MKNDVDQKVIFYVKNSSIMDSSKRREYLKELLKNIDYDCIYYLLKNGILEEDLDIFIPETIDVILKHGDEYLGLLYYRYGISCDSIVKYVISRTNRHYNNIELFGVIFNSELYTESEKSNILPLVLDYCKDKSPDHLIFVLSKKEIYPDFYSDLMNSIISNNNYEYVISLLYYYDDKINSKLRKVLLEFVYFNSEEGILSILNSPSSADYFNKVLVNDDMFFIKKQSRIKERNEIYNKICNKLREYPNGYEVYNKTLLYDDFDRSQLLDYFITIQDGRSIFSLASESNNLTGKLFAAFITYCNLDEYLSIVVQNSNIPLLPMMNSIENKIDTYGAAKVANTLISMVFYSSLTGEEAKKTFERMLDILIKINNNNYINAFCKSLYLYHLNDIPYESIVNYIISCDDDVIIKVCPYISGMSSSLWEIIANIVLSRKNSDKIFELMKIENAPLNILNTGLRQCSNKDKLIEYIKYKDLNINIKNIILNDLLSLEDFNSVDCYNILKNDYKFDSLLLDRLILMLINDNKRVELYDLCFKGLPINSRLASYLTSNFSYQELVNLNNKVSSSYISDYLKNCNINIDGDITEYIINNIDEFLRIGLAGIINLTNANKSAIFTYLTSHSEDYEYVIKCYSEFLMGNSNADIVDKQYFDYIHNYYSLIELYSKKGMVLELEEKN